VERGSKPGLAEASAAGVWTGVALARWGASWVVGEAARRRAYTSPRGSRLASLAAPGFGFAECEWHPTIPELITHRGEGLHSQPNQGWTGSMHTSQGS